MECGVSTLCLPLCSTRVQDVECYCTDTPTSPSARVSVYVLKLVFLYNMYVHMYTYYVCGVIISVLAAASRVKLEGRAGFSAGPNHAPFVSLLVLRDALELPCMLVCGCVRMMC